MSHIKPKDLDALLIKYIYDDVKHMFPHVAGSLLCNVMTSSAQSDDIIYNKIWESSRSDARTNFYIFEAYSQLIFTYDPLNRSLEHSNV